METPFPKKEKSVVTALYLQSIKTFLTLQLSRYCKSGSMFSSSEPVAASSDCRRLGNALCLCSPVLPAPAVAQSKRAAPRAWPLILPSKPSINFWNSLQRDCQFARWPAGAWTWTQTWTVPPDQRVVKVLSAPKPQNKLCGVSILFRSIKNAEIEDICPRQYQPLSPDCCIVPQFWRSQKNSNSTQFIELYFGVSEQIKPLQPTGQAAEFKFETKFEALSPCLPVPVI